MSNLQGKVAVVTGASKGIGAGIARALGAAGAAVVVNYASDRAGADKAVADIKAKGGKAVAVKGDVSKSADVKHLFDETRKAFGIAESVDGVVVTEVAPGSAAAEKGLKPGDVIVEVAQEFMKSPDAVATKVQTLKQEGRRNAQMMVAAANGDLRFVAVPME